MKKIMPRLLAIGAFIWLSASAFSQPVLNLVSPSGLTPPYQVPTGTTVTLSWDYFGSPPTYGLTHDQDPDLAPWQFSLNPDWNQFGPWTDADMDGIYEAEITIDSDIWVFAAFNTFSGNTYSNVIAIQAISGISITADAEVICPVGGSVDITAPSGYDQYIWLKDGQVESAGTSEVFTATTAGNYSAQIVDGSDTLITNTVALAELAASFSGDLNMSQLKLSSDRAFDSYQWWSGTESGNLSPIAGATDSIYLATLTGTDTYYALEGTLGGCTVVSAERKARTDMFAVPIIQVNADTNAQGQVCDGNTVTLTAPDGYGTYEWFKDGVSNGNTSPTIQIFGAWGNGDYGLVTTPADWPEIALSAADVSVNILKLTQPGLSGANFFDYFCEGEDITIILSDEGYTYTWYLHEEPSFGPEDIISVPTGTYNHTFDSTIRVTVVGEFQGCEAQRTVTLRSYEDQSLSVSINDFDQKYLCLDSSALLSIPSWQAGDWENFQWFVQEENGDWTALDGETNDTLKVNAPGLYRYEASSISCPTAVVTSSSYEILDYTEREPFVWASPGQTCEGDTAMLNLSGNSWTAIQWFGADIQIGQGGYGYVYVPLANNSGTNQQEVDEWGTYLVKAKHTSCPNGLKVESAPIQIQPAVYPEVEIITDLTFDDNNIVPFDSIPSYIGCEDQPVQLAIQGDFDSIQWHALLYSGADDYALGAAIPGATGDTLDHFANVEFITAVVEKDGCIGRSRPVLLDAWAFASPTITSYNNSEICEPGDSTLIHVSFPGPWVKYEWLHNLEPIPNSDNDSIYVKEEGEYIVFTYPEQCPDVAFTSGQGPFVTILEPEILETDSFIYVLPFQGFYDFQWYLDGNPIAPHDPNVPWVLFKDQMQSGVYTVEVTNPEPCTQVSEPYLWDPVTDVDDLVGSSISVYPNPARDLLNITGIDSEVVKRIRLFDVMGRVVRDRKPRGGQQELWLGDLANGVYFLQFEAHQGKTRQIKIVKN